MPTYTYECSAPRQQCGGTFEYHQSINDPPLTQCPTCGKSCKRIITSFSMTAGKLGFDLGKAKASGMQVLKRRDKGVYEKL